MAASVPCFFYFQKDDNLSYWLFLITLENNFFERILFIGIINWFQSLKRTFLCYWEELWGNWWSKVIYVMIMGWVAVFLNDVMGKGDHTMVLTSNSISGVVLNWFLLIIMKNQSGGKDLIPRNILILFLKFPISICWLYNVDSTL